MGDQLKDFVNANRDEFECYQTDTDSLWEGIEEGLLEKEIRKARTWKRVWQIAAMLVIGVGISFYFMRNNQQMPNEQELAYYLMTPEWAETEQYYADLVEEKLQMIEAQNMQLDPSILGDLEMLDEAYDELRQDLQDNADNEEVIEAMIQNYQIKLKILERIMVELQKKNREDEDEESI